MWIESATHQHRRYYFHGCRGSESFDDTKFGIWTNWVRECGIWENHPLVIDTGGYDFVGAKRWPSDTIDLS